MASSVVERWRGDLIRLVPHVRGKHHLLLFLHLLLLLAALVVVLCLIVAGLLLLLLVERAVVVLHVVRVLIPLLRLLLTPLLLVIALISCSSCPHRCCAVTYAIHPESRRLAHSAARYRAQRMLCSVSAISASADRTSPAPPPPSSCTGITTVSGPAIASPIAENAPRGSGTAEAT